jgi:hypothetical protein
MLMRRQVIFLVAVLIAGCSAQQEPEITIDSSARAALEALPGTLGIALHGSDIAIQVALRHGQIESARGTIRAPREATGMVGPRGATMLPDRLNEYYQGPYGFSPDSRYVAASVVEHRPKAALPQAFVIFDQQMKRDTARVTLEGKELLRALAWSPDSMRLAVLKSTSRGKFSFKNMLSAISGHPVPYDTYFLDIYNLDGKIVTQTKLIEDVRAGWGEITWTHRN